jgi:hypothetical protein
MKNREIINRLSELIEEAIINYPDDELLKEFQEQPDPDIDRNLKFIKKLNTVTKAKLQKGLWVTVKEEIDRLIQEVGRSEFLDGLLRQPQYKELLGFFSKYKEVNEEDRQSMLTDRKMLDLIKKIKEELRDEKSSN